MDETNNHYNNNNMVEEEQGEHQEQNVQARPRARQQGRRRQRVYTAEQLQRQRERSSRITTIDLNPPRDAELVGIPAFGQSWRIPITRGNQEQEEEQEPNNNPMHENDIWLQRLNLFAGVGGALNLHHLVSLGDGHGIVTILNDNLILPAPMFIESDWIPTAQVLYSMAVEQEKLTVLEALDNYHPFYQTLSSDEEQNRPIFVPIVFLTRPFLIMCLELACRNFSVAVVTHLVQRHGHVFWQRDFQTAEGQMITHYERFFVLLIEYLLGTDHQQLRLFGEYNMTDQDRAQFQSEEEKRKLAMTAMIEPENVLEMQSYESTLILAILRLFLQQQQTVTFTVVLTDEDGNEYNDEDTVEQPAILSPMKSKYLHAAVQFLDVELVRLLLIDFETNPFLQNNRNTNLICSAFRTCMTRFKGTSDPLHERRLAIVNMLLDQPYARRLVHQVPTETMVKMPLLNAYVDHEYQLAMRILVIGEPFPEYLISNGMSVSQQQDTEPIPLTTTTTTTNVQTFSLSQSEGVRSVTNLSHHEDMVNHLQYRWLFQHDTVFGIGKEYENSIDEQYARICFLFEVWRRLVHPSMSSSLFRASPRIANAFIILLVRFLVDAQEEMERLSNNDDDDDLVYTSSSSSSSSRPMIPLETADVLEMYANITKRLQTLCTASESLAIGIQWQELFGNVFSFASNGGVVNISTNETINKTKMLTTLFKTIQDQLSPTDWAEVALHVPSVNVLSNILSQSIRFNKHLLLSLVKTRAISRPFLVFAFLRQWNITRNHYTFLAVEDRGSLVTSTLYECLVSLVEQAKEFMVVRHTFSDTDSMHRRMQMEIEEASRQIVLGHLKMIVCGLLYAYTNSLHDENQILAMVCNNIGNNNNNNDEERMEWSDTVRHFTMDCFGDDFCQWYALRACRHTIASLQYQDQRRQWKTQEAVQELFGYEQENHVDAIETESFSVPSFVMDARALLYSKPISEEQEMTHNLNETRL